MYTLIILGCCLVTRPRPELPVWELALDKTAFSVHTTREDQIHQAVESISHYPLLSTSYLDGHYWPEEHKNKAVYYIADNNAFCKPVIWLQKHAEDGDLIKLTGHPNLIVRAWAFYLLVQRDHPECERLMKLHLNDKTKIEYHFGGCVVRTSEAHFFYLKCMAHKLDPAAYMNYLRIISAQYTMDEWLRKSLIYGMEQAYQPEH